MSEVSSHALVDGRLGPGCRVGPFAVIAEDSSVGAGCVIHAHAVIGAGVEIGDNVEVMASAVIGREPKGAGATARPITFERRLSVGAGCSIGAGAVVYYDVVIGTGCLIGDGASIREGARIGSGCLVSRLVTLNYDVVLGDGVKVMDGTHLTGGTRVGERAFIGPGVMTTNDNAPTEPDGVAERLSGPTIEPRAVVGAGVVTLPGVRVGADATVAAGAIVTRDVPAGTTVAGIPARVRAS